MGLGANALRVQHKDRVLMADRLFVADTSGDELWEIDPDGSDTQGTKLRDFPSSLTTPFAMTVLGRRLLVADDNGDELWEIDPDGSDTQGTKLRDFPSSLTTPIGMTVLGTRLLVADTSGDQLWEIDPDGSDTQGTKLRDFPSLVTGPRAMTVLGRRLLVADDDGDELWEIDPDGSDTQGTKLRDFPSSLTTPRAMTVLGTRLLVADNSGDELWEIDPDGSDTQGTKLRDFPSSLTTPSAMTVLPPPIPARPAAPTLTGTDTTVTAVGVEPANDPTSYDWRIKRTSSSIWADRLDQTSLTQTWTSLQPETEYEVQLRATNSEGDSAYSLSGIFTTDALTIPPASFTNVPTPVAGDEWTRAQFILYIVDNLNAIHALVTGAVPGTTFAENDVVVGADAGALAGVDLPNGALLVGGATIPVALAIGTNGQRLRAVNGVVSWVTP